MFGPLLYSTLGVALIAWAYTGAVTFFEEILRPARERQEIRSLAEALGDMNPIARENAARLLVAKGPEAVLPYLLEAARDPQSKGRALACRSLAQVQSDPSVVVPVLIAASDDVHEEVRLEVARDLQRVNVSAALVVRSRSVAPGLPPDLKAISLETLCRLITDRESGVRAAAAEALGGFAPDPKAAAVLVAANGDTDRMVRIAASRALVRFNIDGNRTAIQTLLALVADPDAVADRVEVIDVIRGIGGEVQDEAVTALADLLAHCETAIRPDLINCLQSIGPGARSALPALEAFLNDDDLILRQRRPGRPGD